MMQRTTSSSASGEPETQKPSSKLIKFNKLTEDQHQQMDTTAADAAEVAATTILGNVTGKALFDLKPDQKLKTALKQEGQQKRNSTVGSNTVNAIVATTSTAVEPIKLVKKTSSRNINTLLTRKGSKENMSDSLYLEEALKSFDKKYSKHQQVARKKSATNAETTTSAVEARTISSSYISAHEDSYENYVEVSDASKSKESILNVLYEDPILKKPKRIRKQTSNSDLSNDSIMESGYKSYTSSTTTPRLSQDSNPQMLDEGAVIAIAAHCCELSSNSPSTSGQYPTSSVVKGCMSDVYPICRPYQQSMTPTCSVTGTSANESSSEQISKLIVDLIGPNSRVGKLIFESCAVGSQDTDGIYEEIKQCVQAELQMEDKLTTFFKVQQNAAEGNYDSLKNLDDSLNFVKDHLAQIRSDLNEFKDNCWKKIDSKVSHTEFSDTTAVLSAKMTYLERKLFNEHRLMRQDIRSFREKINHLENDSACGFKNFPFWPFIAFIGAYSIVNMGRR